jgi:hypothetical protein
MAEPYLPPVNQLLIYGDPRKEQEWPDYLWLGFTTEHVPDLIRMTTDPDLIWADPESDEVWAPIHAWRTLGQLRAEEAINPLIALWKEVGKDVGLDDWLLDDLPHTFVLIGEIAIPAMESYIAEPSHAEDARIAAAVTLRLLTERYPDQRNRCVKAITNA